MKNTAILEKRKILVPIVKSFSVGLGDMFYIDHGSDNFTMIDCNLVDENADSIVSELKSTSRSKGITRFISTHPDEDHIRGIARLDDEGLIVNFYVIENDAIKPEISDSFERYCKLRDGNKAFKIFKGCSRRWMNQSNEERGASGINILWPDLENEYFCEALKLCNNGESFNDVSIVIRYQLKDGASDLWLGDLETEFMENIFDDIELKNTTIVFAAHHGRKSGKIPDKWLEVLDPQIIILGEAPSRDLHYYTGYTIITQTKVGDLTMDLAGDKVHFYASKYGYTHKKLFNENQSKFDNYVGSITVETKYTL